MAFLSASNVTRLLAWEKGVALLFFHAKLCFLRNSRRESIAASVNFCDCRILSIKVPELDWVGGLLYSDDAVTEVGDDEVDGGDDIAKFDESL